jgi:hypothetical protein
MEEFREYIIYNCSKIQKDGECSKILSMNIAMVND